MSKDLDVMLFHDLAHIIEQGKNQLVKQVNSTIIMVYWEVGYKINKHILNNQRAEYGKEIVSPLATQLVSKYGRSFEVKNLRRMMQFAEQFTDFEIVVPLARQLSWSHFVELLPIKNQHYFANERCRGGI